MTAYYKAFGKENDFKVVIFDGMHEIDKSEKELNFLVRKLKQIK